MLIQPEIKKCVVYLSYVSKHGKKWAGTGFFVSEPFVEIPEFSVTYLVTSKHLIEGIKKKSIDGKVNVRINLIDGGNKSLSSEIDEWKYHNDESVDVAVLSWTPKNGIFDHAFIGPNLDLTAKVIKDEQINVGDEVFLTGLFHRHKGENRNLPIIRVGNIAMMPDEKVWVGNGFAYIDAYLIDLISIEGLSGSPVFVHLGLSHAKIESGGISRGSKQLIYWLGMMHGHWKEDKLNPGISIVVPAQKIREVINYEKFVKERKEAEKAYKAGLK
jgi:hypothetical protein